MSSMIRNSDGLVQRGVAMVVGVKMSNCKIQGIIYVDHNIAPYILGVTSQHGQQSVNTGGSRRCKTGVCTQRVR